MAERRSFPGIVVAAAALCVLAAGLCPALPRAEGKPSAKTDPQPDKADFAAGKTVRLKIPGIKTADEHFIVHVPADYTPDDSWPVIFWFHGLNGRPTVGLIRRITEGKRFILIGVAYYMRGMEGYGHYKRDIDNLKIVVPYLERFVKLDRRLFFVGGFSKGAFYADRMMCASPRTWAGALMLGGGKDLVKVKDHRALRAKPIFIGCGDKDTHLDSAQKARQYYARYGAQVTFEAWAGLGHQCKTDSKALRKWLWDNGPRRRIQERAQAARAYQKAGKLGRAYAAYRAVAAMSQTEPLCTEAAKAAKTIADKAEQHLAAGRKAAEEGRRSAAMRLLGWAAAAYQGCDFGETARQELDRLRAARTTRPSGGRPGSTTRPGAGDSTARTCRGYLAMAENLLQAGKTDKAKSYLQRIIDSYPNTQWARQAEARLQELNKDQ